MTSQTYVADIKDVPFERLDPKEGWINMQVQFLINAERGESNKMVVGRTVFPPGASSHEFHRHHTAEEFVYVIRGSGVVMNGNEEVHVEAGQIVFHPQGIWHGFRNTSETEEAEVLWAWGGAGDRDGAGYEPRPAGSE